MYKSADLPILIVKSGGSQAIGEWRSHFSDFLPQFEIRDWEDETVNFAAVRYALVWQPEEGRIGQYPNIKAVLSSSAGVDHILNDKLFPANVPIIRMMPDETKQRMAEFVGLSCLLMQKEYPKIIDQQRRRHWQEVTAPRLASQTRVGIMGLGALGATAAIYVKSIGFNVAGWSQTPKEIEGIKTYVGSEDLIKFLAQTDIVVCLLPATEQTRGIINTRFLNALPKGASVINVGRGAHLVEADLLFALDNGHISYAALDVFDSEPPLLSSPFWTHPRVIVTPHSAATPSRREKAKQASISITALELGAKVSHIYDAARGY